MDRLWQNVKDATRSVTVVKTLKTLVALIVIVLITGAYGTLKAHQTNKIELTKTRLVNQMANIYNNAGNIEVGQGFAGETGETYDNGRFVVFDTPQMGMRAIFRDLRTKIAKHDGVLWSIISEYAPPSENNTELYFKHAKMALNGDDMVGEYTLPKLVKAMVKHENKKEVSDYYLSDPKILQEAFALSTMSFPSGTSYEEAKEIYRQEPLHLSHHVPKHLK
jgi:Na+-transporting NADH:ubiquinone oxidoreductase subunit NqrC